MGMKTRASAAIRMCGQTTHLADAIVHDEEASRYEADHDEQAGDVPVGRERFPRRGRSVCLDRKGRRHRLRIEHRCCFELLGLIELAARCRPRVHRRRRCALLVKRSELGGGGVGGKLLEAESRAHLALEIPVDLGHARPDLTATEWAGGVAGAACHGACLAALQHAHPAAAAEGVAAREPDRAEQQIDAYGAAVLRRTR